MVKLEMTEQEAKKVLQCLAYDLDMFTTENKKIMTKVVKKLEKAILYGVEEPAQK